MTVLETSFSPAASNNRKEQPSLQASYSSSSSSMDDTKMKPMAGGGGGGGLIHHHHHHPSAILQMTDDGDLHDNDDDSHYHSSQQLPPQAAATATAAPVSKKLGIVPLAVIVFYNVSGGPFGCEDSVRSAGKFYTLLGFLIMPLVWSLQEASVTAELGSTFPESSGAVAWVEEAFGATAGWTSGYLNWMAGATDNAIYPVLFLDYLLAVLQPDDGSGEDDPDAAEHAGADHPVVRFFLLASISCSLAYVSYLGLDLVGKMAIVVCLIAMSPFIILVLVGAFKVVPSRWFELPTDPPGSLLGNMTAYDGSDATESMYEEWKWGGVLWRPFLNNLFWNLNSFDAAASYSGDVDDPARIFPRGMLFAWLLVVMGYFFPLLVALGASDAPQHAWVDGYLARIASDVVGPWLGDWTVLAAGVSNIALFLAELSADAFQINGMANRGFLPAIFSQRSQYGTPTYGIILGTTVIVLMGVTNLERLIEMLNFNYSISILFEFSAFLKLRISRPDLHRPWRIPLSTTGCVLFLLPTYIMTVVVLCLASWPTYIFSIIVNCIGVVIFRCMSNKSQTVSGRRGYCCGRQYTSVVVVADDHHGVSTSPPGTGSDDDGMSNGNDGDDGVMVELSTIDSYHDDVLDAADAALSSLPKSLSSSTGSPRNRARSLVSSAASAPLSPPSLSSSTGIV